MNLATHFRQHVTARPESVAIERPDEASDITYAELDREARQVATWIDEHDAERVAILMLNRPSYLAVILGAWRAGAVPAPVNVRFGVTEVEYVFGNAEPDVVFAGPALANRAEEAAADAPVVHLGDRIDDLADPSAAPRRTRFDDDTALLMHTSGTTGDPKPVVQTHRNIGSQAQAGISLYGFSPSDTAVISVPLFHVGGLHTGTLSALFAGGSVALQEFWNAAGWADLVEQTGATYSGLIPAMMTDLLETDAARARETSSLRLCFAGGSPAAESLMAEFESVYDVDEVLALYGQTECSGVTVTYEAGAERRPEAIGKPIPTVEVRLADVETGEPTDDDRGELLIRGDNVARYADADLNEDAFTDGWFHSDDVMRMDDDGYLYFVDRADDIILSGGEKVAPTGVEDVVRELDGVREVAVLGTAHDRWGEAVTAAVVRADETVTESDVIGFCEERDDLANYKKPRRVVFVEELPRTATQKVDKVELADDLPEFD